MHYLLFKIHLYKGGPGEIGLPRGEGGELCKEGKRDDLIWGGENIVGCPAGHSTKCKEASLLGTVLLPARLAGIAPWGTTNQPTTRVELRDEPL